MNSYLKKSVKNEKYWSLELNKWNKFQSILLEKKKKSRLNIKLNIKINMNKCEKKNLKLKIKNKKTNIKKL